MANLTSTKTSLNNLFHQMYSKDTEQSRDDSAILLNIFKKEVVKSKVNFQGKNFPVMSDRGGSFKGIAEFGDFAASVSPTYENWKPTPRDVQSTGAFSFQAYLQDGIEGVNGREMIGLGKELGQQVYDTYRSFLTRVSASCYRDGKGKIASAIPSGGITTGAGGTITYPGSVDYGVELFSVGLPVEFYSSGGTQRTTGTSISYVTAVNYDTGVVTFDNVPTNAVAGDFPVYQGSWDALPHGIEYNVQNQDTTIHSFDVTGKAQHKSQVVDRSGNTFSIKDINKANVRTMNFMGTDVMANDLMFIMNPKLYNGYLNEAYAQSTIQTDANRGSKVDLLYKSATIGGTKIYLDNFAPATQLIGLKRNTWIYISVLDPKIINDEGNYLHWMNATSGNGKAAGFLWHMYGSYELFCKSPAANMRLTNYTITDTYF